MQVRQIKNFIFTRKTTRTWEAHQAKSSDKHGVKSDGQFFSKPAHFEKILLVMERYDDASRSQKEQGFKPCMREDMEETC